MWAGGKYKSSTNLSNPDRIDVRKEIARKVVEVGVMPVLHTFNGKLEFNSHVHALVSARDLQTGSQGSSSIFFDRDHLMDSWNRLIIALLRAALEVNCFYSSMGQDEA
jgi:hypothetical protein